MPFGTSFRSRRDLPRSPCANKRSLTSQGHAYARFRRALDNGNTMAAIAAAGDIPHIGLTDALELCLALRDAPLRGGCGALAARYVLETRGVTLGQSQAVLGLLAALDGPRAPAACAALAELLEGRRGFEQAAEALVRLARTRTRLPGA